MVQLMPGARVNPHRTGREYEPFVGIPCRPRICGKTHGRVGVLEKLLAVAMCVVEMSGRGSADVYVLKNFLNCRFGCAFIVLKPFTIVGCLRR